MTKIESEGVNVTNCGKADLINANIDKLQTKGD